MHIYLETVFGILTCSLFFVGWTISGVRAMLTQFVLINELGFPFGALFPSLCFDQLLLANKSHQLDISRKLFKRERFQSK